MRRARAAGLLVVTAVLAACGGGDSEPASTPAPTALPTTVSVSSASRAQVGADTGFDAGIDAGLKGLRYAWSFGDGTTSTDAKPTHRYSTPGTYEVTVTVTNEAGATRSAKRTVQVGHFANVSGTACSAGEGIGWCWQQPKPTGQRIGDVHFIDAQTGWAVGEGGAILKTADGGTTWAAQSSGTGNDLSLVRFSDANNGWAVGTGNQVLHTSDGGAHWETQALSYTANYGGGGTFWALDARRAVYASSYGYAYTTRDGGTTWQASTVAPAVVTPNGTFFTNHYSTISRSSDLGQTSSTVFSNSIYGSIQQISFADDLRGMFVASDLSVPGDYSSPYALVVWRTADGGNTWTRQPTGVVGYHSVSLFKYSGSGDAWLNTSAGLYRSTDHGVTWRAVATPATFYSYNAPGSAPDGTSLALSAGSTVYATRDGGATWSSLTVAGETSYARLQMLDSNTYILLYNDYFYYGAVADRIYRSTDRGATWNRILGTTPEIAAAQLQSVWFFDARRGVAAASDGSLSETADGGATWTRRSLAPSSSFRGGRLQFHSESAGWLMSSAEGRVYKTTDGGRSWWTPLATAMPNLVDMHFMNDRQGWVVTYSGDVYTTGDGGQSWARSATIVGGAQAIKFVNATSGLVVGQNGLLAMTIDGGRTWQARASGVSAMLYAATWSNGTTAWAVGSNGTVIRSDDSGTSWSRVPVAATTDLLSIRFIDASRGWIVGANGTVLATVDGGRNWTLQATRTSRTFFDVFFTDAMTGWLVGAGGAILATATGGN